MKAINIKTRHGSPKKQQGIATVLLVVLVGLALTATALGIMHSIKSSQQKNVAVNAVTHAQTGVWTGTEAFRRYLMALNEDELLALTGDLTIGMKDDSGELTDAYGAITAKDITVTDNGDGTFRVTADIINIHGTAHSSAALGVAFDLTTAACSNCVASYSSVDFNDDLKITGGIDLIGVSLAPNLNVNGNVEISQVNLTPINQINATGKITILNGIEVNSMFANDDVYLSGTIVNSVRTLGDFTAHGSATVQQAWANGEVTISSGTYGSINALGDINVTGGVFDLLKTASNITTSTSGLIKQAHAVGDVTINSWGRVLESLAMEDITCIASNWGNDGSKFDLLSANGSLINCPAAGTYNGSVTEEGAANSVTPMNPEVAFTMSPNVIDVWALKGNANYIIEYDTSVSKIKVTVNNINNISDGSEFWVGNYPNVDRDGDGNADYNYSYLCTGFNGSGQCNAPATPLVPLCIGESLGQECIYYDTYNDRFTIQPNNTAPGIMWIKGNAQFANGFSTTTFLVTGDISTSGAYSAYSVNYGAYDEVCLALGTNVKDSIRSAFTTRFVDYYPTNLCDKTSSEYTPISTGNIGFASGGYDPSGDGSFSGGSINISAASTIYGAVLAGDTLQTSGATTIYGAVSAAGQDVTSTDSNLISARTVIDLSISTDDYDPTDIPTMDGGTGTPQPDEVDSAKLLWARYL